MAKTKYAVVALYVAVLLVPAVTLLLKFASISRLFGTFGPPQVEILTVMRVLGLYGITLMFCQVMLGAFMQPLTIKVFGRRLKNWHINQGKVAFTLVVSHFLMYSALNISALGIASTLDILVPRFTFNEEGLISLGKFGLVILTIGVLAAIYRLRHLIVKFWRKIHIVNYLAFTLVLVHSFFLGEDAHSFPFLALYPIFAAGLIAAVLYRRVYRVIG